MNEQKPKAKRGRPKKVKEEIKEPIAESSKGRTADFESVNGGSIPSSAENKQENDGELIPPMRIEVREVVKVVTEPRLQGFALYKALKAKGFPQGGVGQNMEDPNGTEVVYVPHTSEVYQYFIGDPSKWDLLRDAIIRAYIELQ